MISIYCQFLRLSSKHFERYSYKTDSILLKWKYNDNKQPTAQNYFQGLQNNSRAYECKLHPFALAGFIEETSVYFFFNLTFEVKEIVFLSESV